MSLKPDQIRLVELVAAGWTDAEIGAEIGVTARAVEGRLVRIRHRLGARNRAELVRLAIRDGAVT